MNRFPKNTVSCRAVVAEQCDMRGGGGGGGGLIHLETKFLHLIDCRGPLLFTEYITVIQFT